MHGLALAEKREKLLKDAKYSMTWHWQERGISRHMLLITNVSLKLGKEEHTLTITLERPGLLIGKGGRDINALQERLTRGLGHPVKILIVEDKQWSGIYVEESY
jgi:hypothetical protein